MKRSRFPEHLVENTAIVRHAGDWKKARQALTKKGLDLAKCVVSDIGQHKDGAFCEVILPDGGIRSFVFRNHATFLGEWLSDWEETSPEKALAENDEVLQLGISLTQSALMMDELGQKIQEYLDRKN